MSDAPIARVNHYPDVRTLGGAAMTRILPIVRCIVDTETTPGAIGVTITTGTTSETRIGDHSITKVIRTTNKTWMQANSQQSWLIYAMGGGFGHLNRALSLARQAVESDVHCTILHNCRYSSMVTESKLWNEENLSRSITLVRIPGDTAATNLVSRYHSGSPQE